MTNCGRVLARVTFFSASVRVTADGKYVYVHRTKPVGRFETITRVMTMDVLRVPIEKGEKRRRRKTSRRLNFKRYVCIGPLDEAQSVLYRAHVPLSFASHPVAGCQSLDFCNEKAKAEKMHVHKYYSTVSFSCYSFFFEFLIFKYQTTLKIVCSILIFRIPDQYYLWR